MKLGVVLTVQALTLESTIREKRPKYEAKLKERNEMRNEKASVCVVQQKQS